MHFQKYAFSLSSKTHRSIHVHTTALLRFRLSTLKRPKTIGLHRGDVSLTLYAHALNTRACDIVGHYSHFDAFPPPLMRYVCVFVFIHF